MYNNVFKPIKTLAWITAAIAFSLVIYWMLPGTLSEPETAMPVVRSTQADAVFATPENQNAIQPPAPTVTPNPTQTPLSATAEGFSSEMGYKIMTEAIFVDMDCNGMDEEILITYRTSNRVADPNYGQRDYLGVTLKIKGSDGAVSPAWRSNFDHSIREERYDVEVFSIAKCESFLAVSGWDWSLSTSGEFSSQIYQWNGAEMRVVLDVPESLMDLTGEMVFQQPDDQPFIVTTFRYGYPDPQKGTCDRILTDYVWDGVEFIFVERRTEPNQNCGGSGG